ncbi:MAG TPA: hypothetical protein VKZ60_15460 [Chloroflexota bacterium]|nr:hypothetical protein [Chloroflexota bacterium]
MTAELWPRLVRLLAQLEDRAAYVTLAELQARWSATPAEDERALHAEIERAVREQRVFVDHRLQLDPHTGALRRVRLVRLNRRHPAVRTWLQEP